MPEQAWADLGSVLAYIDARLDQPLSLRAMAGEAHLSVFHFARRFKQATGASPHQYLIQARLERAQALLRAGELSVAAVAHETGFSSQSHFTDFFRRRIGCSPRQFRTRATLAAGILAEGGHHVERASAAELVERRA
jgi:AraC family transcriptional regulator